MPLPLYQGLQAPARPSLDAHMGLWFERYFSAYTPGFDKVDESQKKDWLKTCVRQQGNKDYLLTKAARTLQMVERFGGAARVYHCAGRFVSGIGNAHPLENGFSWHPTLGMPYLPGSAVKGLVRAVIETALDESDAERDRLLTLWFGTKDKEDVAEQAGAFIFLDALPVAPCELKAEVLTPHMGKWYEKGGKNPQAADTMPGDWHSPVPVLWLVANDLTLQFAAMPRPGAEVASLDDMWLALEYGLTQLGGGAKTAIGYGVFQLDKKAEDADNAIKRKLKEQEGQQTERQHRKALASASAEQRCVLELKDYVEKLPAQMPASDSRTPELWQKMLASVELVERQGDAALKAELHDLLKGARDRKFAVSKNKDKDFKALLARLRAT